MDELFHELFPLFLSNLSYFINRLFVNEQEND